MADGRLIRASDEERESVVTILREHTAQGRLTFDEFDERMNAAYAAKTRDDLRVLTLDLPAEPGPARDGRAHQPERSREGHASGRGIAVPRLTYLLPLAVLAAVLAGSVFTGSYEFPVPLLFLGVFWAFCGRRGCRPRPSGHH